MTTNKESSGEKCPKCGAKYFFGEALMMSYVCGTQTVDGELYHQSDRCLITAQADEIKRLKQQLENIANNIQCGACAEQIFTGAEMAGRKHSCGKPALKVTITQPDHAASLLEKKGEKQCLIP